MISSIHRPAPLGVWINEGRSWESLPVISSGNIEDYSTSWWLWWRSLQPSWRTSTLSRDLRSTGDYNWDHLRKGTQNGFFVVIMSIGLWLGGMDNNMERGRWPCGDAMREVEWVLDQMVMHEERTSLAKRGGDDNSKGAPKSKRARK